MYKLLLCLRYLRTRYIAFASIISLTLGVGAMIVVNAIMLGFASEMEARIHGMLSDIVFEVHNHDGIPDPEGHMQRIREIAGDKIAGMTPTVVTIGMIRFMYHDQEVAQQVNLIGIDARTQGDVSDMAKYLQHPENRQAISFLLKENGYDLYSSQSNNRPLVRPELADAGWGYRRTAFAERERIRKLREEYKRQNEATRRDEQRKMQGLTPEEFAAETASAEENLDEDPWNDPESDRRDAFDPAKEQHTGIIVGIGLALRSRENTFDDKTGESGVEDSLLLRPGDDAVLMFPTAGKNVKAAQDVFTVVDLFESRMSDQDGKYVFVPIEKLQQLRGMIDPETGVKFATQILIKAKPGVKIEELRDTIRGGFRDSMRLFYSVRTWKDCQETLLGALFTELAMINVLLFLIFAVAGFGILAIFFMIVIEKTKDIGILKSLGAGGLGIMQIFLMYSLSLGIVGACAGVGFGLLFVAHIKEIAKFLSMIMGHDVFDPTIYSFTDIPAVVRPETVCWIVAGAIVIAVCSGILPALRAARMKPVESLRS